MPTLFAVPATTVLGRAETKSIGLGFAKLMAAGDVLSAPSCTLTADDGTVTTPADAAVILDDPSLPAGNASMVAQLLRGNAYAVGTYRLDAVASLNSNKRCELSVYVRIPY
jgi:hypothetical protein